MTSHKITLEHLAYALAFALALTLRFLHLGALPLTDSEADLALQALQVAHGIHPVIGPNPAYVLITAILFFLFGASEFLARFWPALAGSMLVLLPYFFRDRLGRGAALILAFALAFEPGLLVLARTAGSSILAIAILALAWVVGRERRFPLVGIFAGLALLSGPAIWMGLFLLGLGVAIWQVFIHKRSQTNDPKPSSAEDNSLPITRYWKITLIYGIGTLLAGGTLFLLAPNGLSGFVASFLVFIKGWWTISGVPVTHLLISLPAYQLMALIYGIIALVRGILARDRLVIGLGVWTGIALLMTLAYPAHQMADLAWSIIPLWILTALELGRYTNIEGVGGWELSGVTALTIASLVFAWLNLMTTTAQPALAQSHLLVAGGALLILGLSLALIGFGWSMGVTRLGAAWGGAAFLLAFTLGAATGAAGLHETLTVELWSPVSQTIQTDLLQKTLDDLSEWNKGHIESLSVTLVRVDSPALRWSLRDWEVKEADALLPTDTPPLVITALGVELKQGVAYRGEVFSWRCTPAWDQAQSSDWLRWFVFREMTQQKEEIVLWARSDLFFGNETGASP